MIRTSAHFLYSPIQLHHPIRKYSYHPRDEPTPLSGDLMSDHSGTLVQNKIPQAHAHLKLMKFGRSDITLHSLFINNLA